MHTLVKKEGGGGGQRNNNKQQDEYRARKADEFTVQMNGPAAMARRVHCREMCPMIHKKEEHKLMRSRTVQRASYPVVCTKEL